MAGLSATRRICSDKLTLVTKKTLHEVEEAVNLAQDELEREYLYVSGWATWRAGRGSVYYAEDRNGEKTLPVFSSPGRANEYENANFGAPQSHMDMLESVPEPHAKPLTEGSFILSRSTRRGWQRRR